MIVSGIAGIEINDLKGYILPFVLMAVAGGVVTMFWLWYMSGKLYPNYRYEGFISMYGMLTGTVSSGVLLLRELDPMMKTPAANNLVLGSSFGIIFGAPVLILVSLAAQSDFMVLVTLGLVLVYLAVLTLIIFKVGSKKKAKKAA
jgi:ESS family glutamate:Na+ symporter